MVESDRAVRAFPEVTVHFGERRQQPGVVCQSTRSSAIELIVLHDTEGGNIPHSSRDLLGVGEFFDRRATEASSTVCTDRDGHSARYVPSYRKAWAQVFYNSPALSIEQIGFHGDNWSHLSVRPQLDETARWIALWSHIWRVPIRAGRVTTDGRIAVPGVLQHRDLKRLGGGHTDVDVDYPQAFVLRRARAFYVLQARDRGKLGAIAGSRWERG